MSAYADAMDRNLKRVLVALVVCLCGCVSVPLSTLVRMSTFDERDFVQLDPEVLRIRIKLLEAFHLDVAKSRLGVELTSRAGSHKGMFALEQELVQPEQIPGGLFARDLAGTAYTMRLSAASKIKFRELQAFVRQGKTDQVTIQVVPILSAFPDDAASTDVWIELLLSHSQGYFTLLDGAEIPLEKIRAASSGS
jgi:hypothetical protein